MQNKFSLQKFKILSGSALKLIAMITMLIDHTAVVLQSVFPVMRTTFLTIFNTDITLYFLMRRIGRVAFPIYCFLICEGFLHTRNKRRYSLRLLFFALLSELPFNLMLSGHLLHDKAQNVFFTLFLGVMALYAWEHVEGNLRKAALMFATLLAAYYLRTDYSLGGVVLILLIYLLRQHPVAQAVAVYPLLNTGVPALCAFIPINMYNGTRGFIGSGWLKYLFYLFYPVHMLLLAGLRQMISIS